MSYDNFNNNNSNDDDNDVLNSQWRGGTWTDSSYTSQSSDSTTSYYHSSDYGTGNTTELTNTRFEENVIAQSFVFMAIALLISAFTAVYVYSSPRLIVNILYNDSIFYVLLFSELAIVFAANFTAKKNMVVPSAVLFTLYSVINGATLSVIFVVFELSSIASILFVTAGMFGGMAIYGLVTKKDLSSIGSIALMALLGIILASVVNMFFLKSSGFDMALNAIGVLIFVALTAYDVQKIKNMARYTNLDNITCIALIGALELYLDFVNIFLKLLALFGRRRN